MPSATPSQFQAIVSNQTAYQIAMTLERDTPVTTRANVHALAPTSADTMPELPASAVKAWAGACAETYRKLMLDYWKTLGLFPS